MFQFWFKSKIASPWDILNKLARKAVVKLTYTLSYLSTKQPLTLNCILFLGCPFRFALFATFLCTSAALWRNVIYKMGRNCQNRRLGELPNLLVFSYFSYIGRSSGLIFLCSQNYNHSHYFSAVKLKLSLSQNRLHLYEVETQTVKYKLTRCSFEWSEDGENVTLTTCASKI